MLRVTINGKSAKTALGIRVPSKDWDVKRSRCRVREHTESKRINIFLENARSKCNRAYTSLQDEYDVVTADMVINSILGRSDGKHQGIIEIYQKQVDELESIIGKNSSYALFQKNRTAMNHLKSFLKSKHSCSDLPIVRLRRDSSLAPRNSSMA